MQQDTNGLVTCVVASYLGIRSFAESKMDACNWIQLQVVFTFSACDIQFVGEIFHVRYMGKVELSKETKFGVSNLVLCCFRSYQIDKSPSLRTKIGLPSLVFSL